MPVTVTLGGCCDGNFARPRFSETPSCHGYRPHADYKVCFANVTPRVVSPMMRLVVQLMQDDPSTPLKEEKIKAMTLWAL